MAVRQPGVPAVPGTAPRCALQVTPVPARAPAGTAVLTTYCCRSPVPAARPQQSLHFCSACSSGFIGTAQFALIIQSVIVERIYKHPLRNIIAFLKCLNRFKRCVA